MKNIIVLIVVVVLIYLLERPQLKESGRKQDWWVFIVLLVFSFLYGIAFFTHLPFPNLRVGIEYAYRPLSEYFFSKLE